MQGEPKPRNRSTLMQYPLLLPDAAQPLSVQTGIWGDNPVLLAGGVLVPETSGAFVVPAKRGGNFTIRFKNAFLDTVPIAYVNDNAVRLAPPLAWWQYLLCALPLGLLLVGGATGGLIGAICAYGNVALFRGLQAVRASAILRYVLPLLVTIGAVALHRGILFGLYALLPAARQ